MQACEFPFYETIILEDDRVRLRPLKADDLEALTGYVRDDQELFRFALTPMNTEGDLKEYISSALLQQQKKLEYPFVVIDKISGKIAGTTRFYLIDTIQRSLAIGYTWIGTEFHRTGLNRSMKALMISYSLKELGFERVEFRLDSENERSARALEAIGALKEGKLRSHMFRADGTRRDTLIYSILKNDLVK
jgi:RimJ/RimL family protein N-acetyltransferase